MDHLRTAFDEHIVFFGASALDQDRHGLKFAFVLINLQNVPTVMLLIDGPQHTVMRAGLNVTSTVVEHPEIDLVAFDFSSDHFHRVAAAEKTHDKLAGVFVDLLQTMFIFDVENGFD